MLVIIDLNNWCEWHYFAEELRTRDHEIDDLRRKLSDKERCMQGMTPPPPAPIVNGGGQQQTDNMELLTNALANVAAAAYM